MTNPESQHTKDTPTKVTPWGWPWNWEVLGMLKKEKQSIIESVKQLTPEELSLRLEAFRDINLGVNLDPSLKKSWKTTFEMVALYQRALQILGKNTQTLKVDTHFWDLTHQALLAYQKDTLKFTWKNLDGLPGTNTTKAILEKLKELHPKPQAQVKISKETPAPIIQAQVPKQIPPTQPTRWNPSTLWEMNKMLAELKRLQNEK